MRMARRRNEKSLAEAAAGLVMMVVALAILSPVFRGQLISTLSMIIAILFLVGVVALIIYLIVYLKKEKVVPQSVRHIKRSPIRPAPDSTGAFNSAPSPAGSAPAAPFGYSPEEQARIQEIIQSMQPAQHETSPSKPTTWNDTVLTEIEWKRFETVTKEFLAMSGYEAQETNIGADGGVDIRLTKPGTEGFKGIVQCKAWNTYKVGVKPVRELFGVMAAEMIKSGMLITSGAFTAEAEEFAKGKMTLISGRKFLELIWKLPEDKQQRLLNIALEGDYSTPTCPQCDIKMTLREGRKGRNPGSQFWGCVRYPRCKQTLVYKGQ